MQPGISPSGDPFAFISYARADEERVLSDLAQLGEHRFRFWYDQEALGGGDKWMSVIPKKVAECNLFVLFLSPASVKSEWVLRELNYAAKFKKPILPVTLAPTEVPVEFDFWIHDVQHIAGHGEPHDRYQHRLRAALKAVEVPDRSNIPLDPCRELRQRLYEAGNIQASLFMTPPPLPPRYRLARQSEARLGLGGDFTFAVSSGSSRILAGLVDVAGHGPKGSVLANVMQGAIQSLSDSGLSIEAVADRLNRVTCRALGPSSGQFAAAVLVEIPDDDTALKLVGAGMPALHVPGAGGRVTEIEARTFIMGIDESMFLPEVAPITMRSGDSLVLFSDGITENQRPDREMFGFDRLKDVLARCAAQKLEIIAEVNRELRDFAGGEPPQDDMSLLVISCD